MALDFSWVTDWIREELAERRSIADSMARLIDRCEDARTHADWSRLRSLPYQEEAAIVHWTEQLFRDEPPSKALRGLWCGLFNPVVGDAGPVADLHLCGSLRFDPSTTDWAAVPDWAPERRCESTVLAAIYRLAYSAADSDVRIEGMLGSDAEYPLCLAYGALAMRDVLAALPPSLLLGDSRSLGVAVGFDSGDFLVLGELNERGLWPVDTSARSEEDPLQQIREGLRSGAMKKRLLALLGLPRLGDSARELVPELLQLARETAEPPLRQAALRALASLAPEDSAAREAVLGAFRDASPSVRREALEASVHLRGLESDDLARIAAMKSDPDPEVARWSEIALRNIAAASDGA